jgi:UDP-glucose 4-epimerase
MKQIFVTGARGFIGRHVARDLSLQGYSVVGLGHGAWVESEYREWGISDWLNGDISHVNLDALAKLHGLPDGIIHLAGGSSVGASLALPVEDFRRSVITANDLAEWVRLQAPSAAIVMASSAAVYGSGHFGQISEKTECRPFSPYGFNKRMAELAFESYARNFGLKVVSVRFFSIYGPELRKQVLWDSCSRLAKNSSILKLGGTGFELRDWLHVTDASVLLRASLDFASEEFTVINGGTGIATPVSAIAQQLADCWRLGAKVEFSGLSRTGDPLSLVADISLLENRGLQLNMGWQAGIAEYVAWFKTVYGIHK